MTADRGKMGDRIVKRSEESEIGRPGTEVNESEEQNRLIVEVGGAGFLYLLAAIIGMIFWVIEGAIK